MSPPRRPRARCVDLPEAIRLVMANKEVPFSRENRCDLAHAIYLGPALGEERLPEEIEQRALAALSRLLQAERH